MAQGEGVAAVVWLVGAGLVLSLAAACGDKEQPSAGGDDGGFYDGGAGDGGDGADGADGAEGGGEGVDGGDGATDGGLDEGGGTTGGGSGSGDGASDDGWDGGDGDVSPTPVWEPDLAVSCADALDYQLHIIDSSGRPCTDACAIGEVWLGGAIVNPCDAPLTVSLDGGMVIAGGSLLSSRGEGMGWAGGSDGTVTTIEIAPGSYVQATESIGELGPEDWTFSITFGDPDRHTVETVRNFR